VLTAERCVAAWDIVLTPENGYLPGASVAIIAAVRAIACGARLQSALLTVHARQNVGQGFSPAQIGWRKRA
jgi:hypothetical protein